ncbi:MAG: hypothetical protein R3330_04800 [Saprospiraceae bacterium]|nr:hypothetical protein [Saprospiraceae bacterium]
MKGDIGVWIDLKRAVLIGFTQNTYTVKTIKSPVVSRLRVAGEGKQSGRFGSQFLDDERTREQLREQQIHRYTREVIAHLCGADQIVIFGPAEMKTRLKQVIEEQPVLAPRLRAVVPTDSMTENQMVAWVKDYFS